MRFWRRPRTGGHPVSRAVHRLVREADGARDEGRWSAAAAGYAAVLRHRPDLYHIHIQHGHALKELADWTAAEAAYEAAVRLAPQRRDGVLHGGHVRKLQGRFDAAAASYAALVVADPGDEEALREVGDTLAQVVGPTRQAMARALLERLDAAGAMPDDGDGTGRADDGQPPPVLAYDATDLLLYFRLARRPSGVQRVQIEVLVHALDEAGAGGRPIMLCAFVNAEDGWVEVPAAAFLCVARLSVDDGGDARAWRRRCDRLILSVLARAGLAFAPGTVLVNLGAASSPPGYAAGLRRARARFGVRYVPLIHDMIPVLYPDWFVEPLVEAFAAWLSGVLDEADGFLANSAATKRDLIAVAARKGRIVDAARVRVVPLDAGFGDEATAPSPGAARGEGDHVLFVSTIEPRKGHLVAFDAWSMLIERLGAARVPRLVCVGHGGWRNAAIHRRLGEDPRLGERVTIVEGISDAALADLYERSLFTIYPSYYEGWGLPVTESLCRGKPVVTTTSSSLPEAGGDLAVYVPPGDAPALAAAAERLIAMPDERRALERRIEREFRPRSWRAIARQVADDAVALARESAAAAGGGEG